ncbi:MAG: hypothetical protein U1F12_03125 [Pseudomonadales bacterium]
MKTFPAFIATTAAFVSMQVAAASYGIDSSQPYYKGASTAQTVGSCTIYKSYSEAWWGQVKDPSGANIGEGLIAKKGITGSEYVLVALLQSTFYLGGQINNVSGKLRSVSFVDMSNAGTASALQALATNPSCAIDWMQASPQARITYTKTPIKPAVFTETFTLLYLFGGAGNPVSSTAGNLTTDTAKIFNGKINFVGKKPALTVTPPVPSL